MSERPQLQIRRAVPSSNVPLASLSVVELQHELQRRISMLQKERTDLLQKVAEIEVQLDTLGVDPGDPTVEVPARSPKAPRRRRPTNQQPLIEVLHAVLKDRPDGLTTREAAEGAIAAGYQTTSKTFANIVNTAMAKDDRFHRVDGRWHLTS